MAIAVARGCPGQALRHAQIGEPKASGKPLLRGDHQIHDAELEALGLMDRQHVHRGLGLLEVGGRGIIPGFAQELEMRDHERRAV